MTISIQKEWNVNELAGLPRPFLTSIACDPANGLMYASEVTTKQIIQFDPAANSCRLFKFLDTARPGALHFSASNQVYVGDEAGGAVHVLDSDFTIVHSIILGKGSESIRVSSTEIGPLVVWKSGVFRVCQFDREAKPVWRHLLPNVITDARPVCTHDAVCVVAYSGATDIIRYGLDGRLLDLETLYLYPRSALGIGKSNGENRLGWQKILLDATNGRTDHDQLVLCQTGVDHHSKTTLFLRDPSKGRTEYEAGDINTAVSRLSQNQFIGVTHLPSPETIECRLSLFHLPDETIAENEPQTPSEPQTIP